MLELSLIPSGALERLRAFCQLTLSKTSQLRVSVGSFQPDNTKGYQATNVPA
jgi:hypothetical protein